MSSFLYWFPQCKAVTPQHVKDADLGYAFDRKSWAVAQVIHGPDGFDGCIVADTKTLSDDRVGYYPDKQTWRRIPKSSNWVGYYTDDPPRESDLRRYRFLRGHLVKLGDECEWTIPVARAVKESDGGVSAYIALPTTTDLDANGEWVTTGVVPRYRRLWDIAERWFNYHFGGGEDIEPAWVLDAAVEAIASNYRVSRIECVTLGLVSDQAAVDTLNAVIDLPTIHEIGQKKTQPESSSAQDGLAD